MKVDFLDIFPLRSEKSFVIHLDMYKKCQTYLKMKTKALVQMSLDLNRKILLEGNRIH